MRLLAFVFLSYSVAATAAAQDQGAQTVIEPKENTHSTIDSSYLSIPFETITGDTLTLNDFKGHVLLLVNVASKCGFTHQYSGLEELYRKYKDQGLVVIGFPANNFGNQEPGTNQEILEFCTSKFDVTFPMMSKISVVGKDKHPLYVYLTEKSPLPGEIEWNFFKFLLDRDGKLVARFPSKTEPMSTELVSQVEKLLQKSE
jgi:glutathione peroxidase